MTDTIIVVVLGIIMAAAAVFGVLVDRGYFSDKKKGDKEDERDAQ